MKAYCMYKTRGKVCESCCHGSVHEPYNDCVTKKSYCPRIDKTIKCDEIKPVVKRRKK